MLNHRMDNDIKYLDTLERAVVSITILPVTENIDVSCIPIKL